MDPRVEDNNMRTPKEAKNELLDILNYKLLSSEWR